MDGTVDTRPLLSRIRRHYGRAKPILLSALRVAVTVAATLAVNLVLLLIAIPIGIATDHLFWSVAITEFGLLAACGIAAAILAVRARRGLGLGLIVGWAIGYVGLIGVVVALIIAAVLVVVVWWLFIVVLYAVVGLVAAL